MLFYFPRTSPTKLQNVTKYKVTMLAIIFPVETVETEHRVRVDKPGGAAHRVYTGHI